MAVIDILKEIREKEKELDVPYSLQSALLTFEAPGFILLTFSVLYFSERYYL